VKYFENMFDTCCSNHTEQCESYVCHAQSKEIERSVHQRCHAFKMDMIDLTAKRSYRGADVASAWANLKFAPRARPAISDFDSLLPG